MSITSIEWTQRPGTIGETWNPTTGCNKVDRGCKNCYAEIMHRRLMLMKPDKYTQPFLAGAIPHPETLEIPLKWKKPRTVFVDSMSDLFHENIPMWFLEDVFKVMRATPQHTYLILTKRPERLIDFEIIYHVVENPWPPNVWIGTSINDQASADIRIPLLLKIPAALRFISYEPATGPADISRWLGSYWRIPMTGDAPLQMRPRKLVYGIDWVICGGESGHKAVPMHPDWARRVRDDCATADVPFFFKQFGNWEPVTYYKDHHPVIDYNTGPSQYLFGLPHRPQNMRRTSKKSGNLLDGQTHLNFPK
jgi:protein gp37